MASYHVAPLARLVEQFESLPGIGHKSAQRLAYYVLGMPKEKAEQFANTVLEARNAIHYCKVCCNLTDQELCPVCRNEERDGSIICVVEDPRDVFALERTNEFHATYHVLHGAIYPSRLLKPLGIKVTRLAYGIPVGGDLEYADEVTLSRALEGRSEL